MTYINIKRGDTARYFTDTLTIDGASTNLSGSSVVLVWKNRDTGTVNRRTATIVTADSGSVSYTVTNADVGTVGRYALEWEVTFDDATVLTYPQDGYIYLNIQEDLG